jgi:hypothetical protein
LRVEITNRNGSVEHYYHFLLGFAIPLVKFYLDTESCRHKPLIVRECGPLTPLLSELNLNLEILPVQEFVKYPPLIQLEGYDGPRFYDRAVFEQFTNYIEKQIPDSLRTRRCEDVILIERGAPDDFYLSPQAEIQGGGNTRRSIRNHSEVATLLESNVPHFKNVRLEGKSLAEQFMIFRSARIIIAQRGAALANLIFANRGARVIEISPLRNAGKLFGGLSELMGLEYELILQENNFPVIDPYFLLNKILADA